MKQLAFAGMVILLMSWTLSCSSDNEPQSKDSGTSTEDSTLESAVADTNDPDTLKMKLDYQETGISWHFSGDTVKIAGVVFVPPLEWEVLKTAGSFAGRFSFATLDGESEPAITEISLLGKDDSSYETMKERLLAMMSLPRDRDPHTAVVEHDRLVDGMTYQAMSIMGIYSPAKGGPGVGMLTGGDNYRVVGIVMKAPDGDILLTLAGPDQTARAMIEAFMRMLWQSKREV